MFLIDIDKEREDGERGEKEGDSAGRRGVRRQEEGQGETDSQETMTCLWRRHLQEPKADSAGEPARPACATPGPHLQNFALWLAGCLKDKELFYGWEGCPGCPPGQHSPPFLPTAVPEALDAGQ